MSDTYMEEAQRACRGKGICLYASNGQLDCTDVWNGMGLIANMNIVMCTDYRDPMKVARMDGADMPFSYDRHCRTVILEEMKTLLDAWEKEEDSIRDDDLWEESLWFLKKGEAVERGIYSWNRPEMDLVIVAPMGLMLLLMGEYKLLAQMMKKVQMPLWKQKADEFYLENGKVCIGGGHYTFGEACLLSADMPLSEKQYFWNRNYYNILRLALNANNMLSEMQFHRNGLDYEEDIWRPIQEVKNLSETVGNASKLLEATVEYALSTDMDRKCDAFWENLFQIFLGKEEQAIIMEALHAYFLNMCSAENLSPRYEERVLRGLEVYFRYASGIEMTDAVESFVLERVASKSYRSGKWRAYLDKYFRIVKFFEGSVSKKWQDGMYDLLSEGDGEWIKLGIHNGFLQRAYVAEYIEYLLQKRMGDGKRSTMILPQLIQIKWQEQRGGRYEHVT